MNAQCATRLMNCALSSWLPCVCPQDNTGTEEPEMIAS